MRISKRLLLCVASSALFFTGDALPRVSPTVHRALRQQGTVNLIVTLKQRTDTVVSSVKEAAYESRGAKIEALVNQLESLAASSQNEVNKVVAQESAGSQPLFSSSKSFWISNQLSFKGASFALVEKLAALPSIAEIREEVMVSVPKPSPSKNLTTAMEVIEVRVPWVTQDIELIGADRSWGSGYDGQGVVVGVLSSGVYREHTSLSENWRSDHGWLDPYDLTASPIDGSSGLGTHVLATAVGRANSDVKSIGVAPGATWIACRGYTDDGGSESELLACAQFLTCPTDAQGNNKDCSKAPRVVLNAWGWSNADEDTTGIAAAIDVWRVAGIIPVFGNSDTGAIGECATVHPPGDSPKVISVGAGVNYANPFSSRGPGAGGAIKPDFVAPGTDVESAGISSTNELVNSDGGEHAAAFVAGTIALLLSKDPSLSFDGVYNLLAKSANREVAAIDSESCGGIAPDTFPNNYAGYGRVDALEAMKLLVPVPTTPGLCTGLQRSQCYYTYGCAYTDNGDCVSSAAVSTPAPTPALTTPAPTRAPTSAPTLAPTPAAGQCGGLSSSQCDQVFFCTWNVASKTCLRWWK